MFLSCRLILLILISVPVKGEIHLKENEIYKWWEDGSGEEMEFILDTSDHTEKLSVYVTDLRPAHADGHGAELMTYNYAPHTNISINIQDIPSIGAGYISIAATFSQPIQLESGEPFHVILNPNDDTSLFKFETSSNSQMLTISLTPFQGNPIAYISNTSIPNADDPLTFQHTIQSHINIAENSIKTYYILLKCASDTEESRFYVTASTYDTNILLQSGVPRQDDLSSGSNRYYYFNVTEQNCNLAIMVTQIVGNPDIFVSRTNTHPSDSDYDYIGNEAGSDYIIIDNAAIHMYYIAVQTAQSQNALAKYTISTILQCEHGKHFTYLVDGVPQMNVLTSKTWAQYTFEFDWNRTISEILIQINPSNGDPDLYVDIRPSNISAPKLWRFHAQQSGPDHLRLLHRNYFPLCSAYTNDTFCTINIAVLAYSATIYTIMVSTNEGHILLQNGKPNTGYISAQSKFTYYMFDLDNSQFFLLNNNITISITPLVSTSDIMNTIFYVDGDSNPMPNEENGYKYKSSDNVHPFIFIAGSQIINDKWNEIYIGVTSDHNLTFTIVATIGTEIQLQDGQTQLGHVSSNHPNYYELIIDQNDKRNQDVEIILASMHGNANIYVSINGMIPNPLNSSTYHFHNSQHGMSIKRILINNTKYNAEDCLNLLCRFYITVSTPDWPEEAEYSLIASTDTAVIRLFDGQPISSQINPNQYEYFSINVDYSIKNRPVLFIETTPITGDINLYVSDDDNNHRPNKTHFNYKSETGGADTDSIIIRLAEERVYYIGVQCTDQMSTFSITATLSNELHPDFIRLLSGNPQQGTISSFDTDARFYQIYVPPQATELKFHFHHSGNEINVYITNNITHDRVPSSDNKLYHLKTGTIRIPNPMEGSWYIGVYSSLVSLFTITATLSDDILMLQNGQSIRGDVQVHQYDYYLMQIHDMTQDFSVVLTSYSAGDPDLFISLQKDSNDRPTRHAYLWSSSNYGSDIITISHDDPKSCNVSTVDCTYVIGVYGFRHSSYSITPSTEETIQLRDGEPIQGSLSTNQWHYYKFQITNEPLMIVVGVTTTTGQNDIYVDLNKEPTSYSYLYAVSYWNQDKNIQIAHTSCEDNADVCTYFIGLKGVTDCEYSVFYQSSNNNNEFMIEDSIPITRTVNALEFIYFKYEILENLKDIQIALTPITGQPQCFISSLVDRPNNANAEYKMTEGIANTVTISKAKNNTIYHFSIFAETESTFSLTVIGEHFNRSSDATGIRLIEGQIIFGATVDWSYYSFSPSDSVSKDIIISVSALSGDPDIYCNLESYPTLSRYLYSANLDGPETLTIPHMNTTWFCAIHADNEAKTEFYIVAYHSHTIVTLIDDIPIIGELNAKIDVNYYHFFAESLEDTDNNGVISLIFTPIYASECALFISWNWYRPNETYHEYAINNTIDNGLNGIDFKIAKSELLINKDWYIAIKPIKVKRTKHIAAMYTLLLTYDNTTTLQEGLPQNGQISDKQVSYYIWNVDLSEKETNKALFVSLSLLSGDCTIYLSRNALIINSCGSGIGCPTHLFDASHSCSDKSPLIISKKDEYYISDGTYYISVCTNTQTAKTVTYYNINVYTSYSILYLANALPTIDALTEVNQYRYYSLLCDNDHIQSIDIVISASEQSPPFIIKGIISTERPRPQQDSITNTEFETQWIEDNGAVFSIDKNDERFIVSSQYFISLYSAQNTEESTSDEPMVYTISAVVTMDDSIEYRVLINSLDQMAIIHNVNYQRYYSFKSNASYSITFTLKVAQGEISMFVIDNQKNENNIPSLHHYQYKMVDIHEEKSLEISNPCHCSYLIIIYASESESIYSIRADTNVPNASHNKANPMLGWVIATVVCIVVVILGIVGVSCHRRNKKLKYELDIAEMQLNMDGKKTLRQRRKELESTTSVPAKPWSKKEQENKLIKQKYSSVGTDENEDMDINVLLGVEDDSDLSFSK